MAVIAALTLAPIPWSVHRSKEAWRRERGGVAHHLWSMDHCCEHSLVGLGELANLPGLPAHAHFHFLMGGMYTFVGAVLLGVVVWTLLRAGSRI